jgi:aminopeptidase N
MRYTDSASFLLNDGLAISRIGGRDVLGYSEGKPADGMRRVVVRFAKRAAADSVTEIELTYAGVLNLPSDSINSVRPQWVELGLDSFWHPVFEDFTQSITASVRLEMPPEFTVVASGGVEKTGGTFTLTNHIPLIDIAFAAAPGFQRADAKRVSVYHVGAPPDMVSKVLETTSSCGAYLDKNYGAKSPLPHVKMVLAPRGGPGYARKNYIVITATADIAPVPLQRYVCHELAHHWSAGAVSSGPENWLNEAFAEFVSARYVRSVSGADAYATIVAQWREQSEGQPPVWKPDLVRRPTARTAYRKAPYLLSRLEERVGTAAMDRILVRFMTEPLRTTPAVLEMIGQVAGAEVATWFREQLAT